MKHLSTLRLYRYWAALKGRTSAPARADLRPYLLGSAMLDIFTLRPDPFVFGYAGSRLRAGLSIKLDGLDFPSLWRAGDQADMLRLLRGSVAHCRPVVLGARRTGSEQVEILLLPTIEASGETGLVGVFAATNDWISTAHNDARLALATISTPEQVLAQEGAAGAARHSNIRAMRPRLLASPTSIALAPSKYPSGRAI